MNDAGHVLAIDQGTTSSRAIVFDQTLKLCGVAQQEFQQHYPQTGWVEHDPEEIWQTTLLSCRRAIQQANLQPQTIKAIGITNQRETTLVWDRTSGQVLYPAIVWQDRRTADFCESLRDQGLESEVSKKTGLLLDPYFSASKVRWILDNVVDAREKAEAGELAFGTIDSFLIWKLTAGRVHATDVTNASRTSLFNIHTMEWDQELLSVFDIPENMLPTVLECADDYGTTAAELLGSEIPIYGVAGDQQAAAIGQRCFSPGDIKSTYGTGCFVLVNTGAQRIESKHNLLTTVGYTIDGETSYAIEGSIFIAGAAIQWLRDGLKIIESAQSTEKLARDLETNQSVYMVPAFTGLGAPYWDANAKGAIFGLTRATGPAELSRAALESIAYLTLDLLDAIKEEGIELASLKIDGGMVSNDWFTQFLADITQLQLLRPRVLESTAMGAAYLAGLKTGMMPTPEQIIEQPKDLQEGDLFSPNIDPELRDKLLDGWKDAVSRTLSKR